eukprot:TRINITY_DN11331_c0_g1_i1.p1 TRINITY_DN11331_c0_g1~~TRINITY_DN11331_c0_g1_i1.p1  ORF type:complete len:161 (+),score=24.84 TRINITY_DN11331_c0_g1_i1:54-536(+)
MTTLSTWKSLIDRKKLLTAQTVYIPLSLASYYLLNKIINSASSAVASTSVTFSLPSSSSLTLGYNTYGSPIQVMSTVSATASSYFIIGVVSLIFRETRDIKTQKFACSYFTIYHIFSLAWLIYSGIMGRSILLSSPLQLVTSAFTLMFSIWSACVTLFAN